MGENQEWSMQADFQSKGRFSRNVVINRLVQRFCHGFLFWLWSSLCLLTSMNRIDGFLLALVSLSIWKTFSCVTDGAEVGKVLQLFTSVTVSLSDARNDGDISISGEGTVCSFNLPLFTVYSHRNKTNGLQ